MFRKISSTKIEQNGSAVLNKLAARAKNEKHLLKKAHIQNNFTEMFLILPSTRIAHIFLLH